MLDQWTMFCLFMIVECLAVCVVIVIPKNREKLATRFMVVTQIVLLIVVILLMAGGAWAVEEEGWGPSGATLPAYETTMPIPPCGVTAWYGGGDFINKWFMIHYRHPWPVRWYDAAVRWLRANLWWPEAWAGELIGPAELNQSGTTKIQLPPSDFKRESPWWIPALKWLRAHARRLWVGEAEAGEDKEIECQKKCLSPPGIPSEKEWECYERCLKSITYPQFRRVPWDEVNGFLRSEAREGRRWEYVDLLILNSMPHIILKREITE